MNKNWWLTVLSFPAFLLAMNVLVLQIHGMAFWVGLIGYTGYVWSVLLESIGLYLWSRRRWGLRALGIVASVLTLTGPLYEVGYEPFSQAWEVKAAIEAAPNEESRVAATKEAKRKILINERETLTASLATYEANSRERGGWLPAIDDTRAALQEVNKQLKQVEELGEGEPLPSDLGLFSGLFIIALQLISLVLFQVVSIICVLTLASIYRKRQSNEPISADKAPAKSAKRTNKSASNTPIAPLNSLVEPQKDTTSTVKSKPSVMPMVIKEKVASEPLGVVAGAETIKDELGATETNSVNELSVEELVDVFDDFFKGTKLTQGGFAKEYGLSAKELSFFRNHKKRAANNERTASEPFVESIRELLSTELNGA